MNRRSLLAGAGSALSASFVGCLNRAVSGRANEDDDAVTPSTGTRPELDEDCGPAAYPLSALLTEDPGDSSVCSDDATRTLSLENEREAELTVTVDMEGNDALSETYTLAPGERVVEGGTLEAKSRHTGTVTIDEEETQVTWPDQSCYRHGIALTPDGIKNGWIEPLRGPGDLQHDCYAGDESAVVVWSYGEARTIEVTVADLCAEEVTTETFDLDGDETERTRELVTRGGMYDFEAKVEDGDSETYEFHEECWGVEIRVEEDGAVSIQGGSID